MLAVFIIHEACRFWTEAYAGKFGGSSPLKIFFGKLLLSTITNIASWHVKSCPSFCFLFFDEWSLCVSVCCNVKCVFSPQKTHQKAYKGVNMKFEHCKILRTLMVWIVCNVRVFVYSSVASSAISSTKHVYYSRPLCVKSDRFLIPPTNFLWCLWTDFIETFYPMQLSNVVLSIF